MDNGKNKSDPLSALLDIIFSRKLLIFIGFLSVFSISIAGAILSPPVYTAYSSIHIKSPAPDRSEISYMKEYAGRTFLQNQIQIIKSRLILEEVVTKLRLHEKKRSPIFTKRLSDKIYTILKISRPILDPKEEAIQYLNKSLSVRPSRGTDIVKIIFTSNSSKLSALLANTLAETYIEYTYRQLFTKTVSGYNFIEKQVQTASQNFIEAEKNLNEFKEREKIFSVVEENSIVLNRLSVAEEKYEELTIMISNLNNQAYQIKNNPISTQQGRIDSSLQYINPEIQELNELLKKYKSDLAAAMTVLTENHPDVKILRKNIERKKLELAQAIENISDPGNSGTSRTKNLELQNLYIEINKLKDARDNLSKHMQTLTLRREELTQKQAVLNRLERDFKNKQDTLLMMNAKLQEARILKEDEMAKGSIKVIDQAYPPPYSSKKKKMILLAVGAIAAIIFSLGMALIAEYLDDSLKTPQEAEKHLNLPVIGTVPYITRKIRKAA